MYIINVILAAEMLSGLQFPYTYTENKHTLTTTRTAYIPYLHILPPIEQKKRQMSTLLSNNISERIIKSFCVVYASPSAPYSFHFKTKECEQICSLYRLFVCLWNVYCMCTKRTQTPNVPIYAYGWTTYILWCIAFTNNWLFAIDQFYAMAIQLELITIVTASLTTGRLGDVKYIKIEKRRTEYFCLVKLLYMLFRYHLCMVIL